MAKFVKDAGINFTIFAFITIHYLKDILKEPHENFFLYTHQFHRIYSLLAPLKWWSYSTSGLIYPSIQLSIYFHYISNPDLREI